MDPISYSKAAQQEQRIKKIIAEPDSAAGLVSVPNLVPTGETITIPSGRTVVHPNLQVDGTLVVDGTLFIPSGGTYTATEIRLVASDFSEWKITVSTTGVLTTEEVV